MKTKWSHYLLWPNLWVGLFTVLALAGIVCLLTGHKSAGRWLLAPLFFGGVILVLVIIPFLIRANRKHRNTRPKVKP